MSDYTAFPSPDAIEDWTPVVIPVEVSPETGSVDVIHSPKSAAMVAEDRTAQEAADAHRASCRGCDQCEPHPARTSVWDRMTLGQREDHRQTCEGCDVCDRHRVTCFQCGHDVDVNDEWCGTCGERWPTSRDPYVKGTEK